MTESVRVWRLFLSDEEIVNVVLSFDADKVTEATKKALKKKP